jgi:hypothetical protein
VNQKDANRSEACLRATREYQHTNRRENKSPAATASPPAGFRGRYFEKKIEAGILLPVDKSSAISTLRLTYRR